MPALSPGNTQGRLITQKIYKVWLENNKPSYCRLHRLIRGGMYDSTSVGPFMNLVKYFRNGWVPVEDTEWKNYYKDNYDQTL